MLFADTFRRVDAYGTGFFGLAVEALRSRRPVLVPHAAGLDDYAGVYLQSFGEAPVVSMPAALIEGYGAGAAEAAEHGLEEGPRWRDLFGPVLDAVIGPAWIGYADARTLRQEGGRVRVRSLGTEDRAALQAFREACTPFEWAYGGSDPERAVVVGAFEGGALVAVAGYEVWGGCIAHLSVVTHPGYRGQGYGRAAVGAAAALAQGLPPQYRTLAANTPSRVVAEALGFVPYAVSLALRLRGGAGPAHGPG